MAQPVKHNRAFRAQFLLSHASNDESVGYARVVRVSTAEIARRINELLALQGKNAAALARHLDLSASAVSRFLGGQTSRGWTLDQYTRVAQFLDVPLDALLTSTVIQPDNATTGRDVAADRRVGERRMNNRVRALVNYLVQMNEQEMHAMEVALGKVLASRGQIQHGTSQEDSG